MKQKIPLQMSDKPIFDPDKLSILDFKLIKDQIESPEEFYIDKIIGHHNDNGLLLAFNVKEKLIKADFTIEIKAESKGANRVEATGSFHLVFIFKVENFDELAKLNRKKIIELDPTLANAISSITYSTARGILLAKLQGTALQNFILPIINPNKLLNNK